MTITVEDIINLTLERTIKKLEEIKKSGGVSNPPKVDSNEIKKRVH